MLKEHNYPGSPQFQDHSSLESVKMLTSIFGLSEFNASLAIEWDRDLPIQLSI